MEENIGTDIVALNRDVEPALLALTGLTFVHTADMHGMPTLWARMVRYIDHYADKIALGGQFVCNLAGHDHHDEFGPTERGVLNLVVQNGTTWDAISDTVRVEGERSEDCFNVVSVDTARSLLTVIRIGANTDKMGRVKRAFCFDYQNKKLISEV